MFLSFGCEARGVRNAKPKSIWFLFLNSNFFLFSCQNRSFQFLLWRWLRSTRITSKALLAQMAFRTNIAQPNSQYTWCLN